MAGRRGKAPAHGKNLTVRFPEEILDKLEEMAIENETSMAAIIRKSVKLYL